MDRSITVFWRARADALLPHLQAVLDWARIANGLVLEDGDIHAVASLRGIACIVDERRLLLPGGRLVLPGHVDLTAMPESLILPLRRCLGDLAGYDCSCSFEAQTSREPLKQHAYVVLAGLEAEGMR